MQMRTTLNLDDDLYQTLRETATRTGRTVTSLLEDAIRQLLARSEAASSPSRVRLTTVRGRGARPGVDLDNSAALAELMDDGSTAGNRSGRRAAV